MRLSGNNCFHVNCCHHGEKDTDPLCLLLMGEGGAFCSELQTLTLAPALQSCSYETLTDRARPYHTIDDICGGTWRGALRVSEHKLHNQHMETSGNSCWSVNKKVNYFVLV